MVFTVLAELNPLIYANQKLLYTLLHKCSSETLLELSSDKKYLGAAPGIIQVLHTWGQTLNFHPHIHCIITGGGLTKDYNLKMSTARFFIPVKVLGSKFRGKFLAYLESYHRQGKLFLPSSCHKLRNSHAWAEFRDSLYQKAWCPYIKETFNGFGNAIEYLGRYTHRIAITNSRIVSVTENEVSFRAKDLQIRRQNPCPHNTGGVYPPSDDACAPDRVPENPVLWFLKQSPEEEKPPHHFPDSGTPEICVPLYQFFCCRNNENRLEV